MSVKTLFLNPTDESGDGFIFGGAPSRENPGRCVVDKARIGREGDPLFVRYTELAARCRDDNVVLAQRRDDGASDTTRRRPHVDARVVDLELL